MGLIVGVAVGIRDRINVGNTVGMMVAMTVGIKAAFSVGMTVGIMVGLMVGVVGVNVGEMVDNLETGIVGIEALTPTLHPINTPK